MLIMIWNCYHEQLCPHRGGLGSPTLVWQLEGNCLVVEFKGCFNGNKRRESWRNAVNIKKIMKRGH